MTQQLQSPTKVMQLLEGNFTLGESHLDALGFQQLSADQLQASQELQTAQAQHLQLAQALQAQQQLHVSQALTAQQLQSLLGVTQPGASQALQDVQQQLQTSQQLQLPGLEAQLTQQLQQAQQLQANQQAQPGDAQTAEQQQQASAQLQQQASQAFQGDALLASQGLQMSNLRIQQLAQQLANAQQLQASQGLTAQQLAQSHSAQQLPQGLTAQQLASSLNAQQLSQGLGVQELTQGLNAQQLPRLPALAALGGSQTPDVTQQMLAAVGLPTQSTAPAEASRMVKGPRPASAKDCKICSKCSLEKPTGEFWKDKTKPDGLYSQCTACAAQREESRRWVEGRLAKLTTAWGSLINISRLGQCMTLGKIDQVQMDSFLQPVLAKTAWDVKTECIWAPCCRGLGARGGRGAGQLTSIVHLMAQA